MQYVLYRVFAAESIQLFFLVVRFSPRRYNTAISHRIHITLIDYLVV